MRICFVLRAVGYNGGTRVLATYASELQRRGHDVRVVCTPPSQPTKLRRMINLLQGRRTPRAASGSFFDSIDVPFTFIDRDRPITARDLPDADAVIATWWETAEWVAKLPARKGAKLYFVQGDESTIEGQPVQRVEATWRSPMQKIAVAEWLRRAVRERGRDDQCVVIPNTVDTQLFIAPPRQKLSRPTVGFVYALEPIKGADLVIEALEHVKAQHPELRALAFGSHAPSPGLPVPDWVELSVRPPQSRIVELYSACDVWVYGARTDGFGLPIVEAMACRTPVVATPAGASPELVDDSVGCLVDATSQAIADGILTMLSKSEAEWKRASDSAFRRAHSYTWETAAAHFESVIEKAVAKARTDESASRSA